MESDDKTSHDPKQSSPLDSSRDDKRMDDENVVKNPTFHRIMNTPVRQKDDPK
jgi:hypothetical protein